ncbi:MAG TPA: hypothetical protein PKA63_04980 [Oligoflexia bacterium]|mgnify:CR=1 FL=1|nr:hypothetical protein [Oligoflexia bacterium]HMP48003.1 hypothetical protein [Oligoflexia bacterium]
MISEPDNYNILVVDPQDATRDSILSSFTNDDVPALIAEAKSLQKAVSYIEESNLHYLFLGPNLQRIDVKEFLSLNDSGAKVPTIVLLPKELLEEASALISEGANAAIPFPIASGEILRTIKSAAKDIGFKLESSKDIPVQSPNSSSVSNAKAHELADVLEKLARRLTAVASNLKDLHSETVINRKNIPDAVNEVITKSSLLRKGKEQEDIKILVKNITSKT